MSHRGRRRWRVIEGEIAKSFEMDRRTPGDSVLSDEAEPSSVFLREKEAAEWNEREWFRENGIEITEEFNGEAVDIGIKVPISGLASDNFLYMPPFPSAEEIRKRRFESGDNNTDNWWEWERELNLSRFKLGSDDDDEGVPEL